MVWAPNAMRDGGQLTAASRTVPPTDSCRSYPPLRADLYGKGLVLLDSLIWREGEAQWLPLKDVPHVFKGLPAVDPGAI